MTPFSKEVFENMSLAEIALELEPANSPAVLAAELEICRAWGITREQRIEQLWEAKKAKDAEQATRYAARHATFDSFLDVLVAELIDTPDEQILEGHDPDELKAKGLALLEAAKVQVF